jgi:hypothetical protein
VGKSTRDNAAQLTAISRTRIDQVPGALQGDGAPFEVASFQAFEGAEEARP